MLLPRSHVRCAQRMGAMTRIRHRSSNSSTICKERLTGSRRYVGGSVCGRGGRSKQHVVHQRLQRERRHEGGGHGILHTPASQHPESEPENVTREVAERDCDLVSKFGARLCTRNRETKRAMATAWCGKQTCDLEVFPRKVVHFHRHPPVPAIPQRTHKSQLLNYTLSRNPD